MKEMKRLAILATLATLALPGSAGAAVSDLPYGSPLFTARATESLRIAQEFWDGATPCPRPLVYYAPSAQLSKATEHPGTTGTTDYCNVFVATELHSNSYELRIAACTITVHEYGHALGYGHSPYYRSVMRPRWSQREVVYGCYKRFIGRNATDWRDQFGSPQWLTK